MSTNDLPVTEHLDFHYLLTLLAPLSGQEEFNWLPELFSIVGHESLINLCRYAGGETIRIPTLDEVNQAIDALQWFYDVNIKVTRSELEVPREIRTLYNKIVEYYVKNDQTAGS